MQTEFSTPDLKDGFQIDVYVDPNLIEVFVNDGEYIISNCVYNLGTDIHQQGNVKYEMYTLEMQFISFDTEDVEENNLTAEKAQ